MANDLYVKNRWILGGLFTSDGTSGIKRKKTERTSSSVDVDGEKKCKKARTGGEGGGGNTKNKNPALI